jgi:hypothetical protein
MDARIWLVAVDATTVSFVVDLFIMNVQKESLAAVRNSIFIQPEEEHSWQPG